MKKFLKILLCSFFIPSLVFGFASGRSGHSASAPGAPTIGTATPVSVGDPNTAIFSVSFTPPSNNGGRPITGYTVTSNPGGISGTGAGSPISVTGLAENTSYTFTVVATNSVGNSVVSSASSSSILDTIRTSTYDFGTTYGAANNTIISTSTQTIGGFSPNVTIKFHGIGGNTAGNSSTYWMIGTNSANTVFSSSQISVLTSGTGTIQVQGNGSLGNGTTSGQYAWKQIESNGGTTVASWTLQMP